ncbi:hypothetical protein RFW15_02840 [Enterococcus faecalis]|uniref:hypothetical protein n=1 Tax=Enterococcus TaxID=1350 RepID=UPI001574144F|nr:hypothetical protein [Enterococcus faecalis]EME3218552.1 hypothetical protein [Enterococcus faecalis]MBD9891103.1 hypothetical protein [Enterococcus faecalis]MBO1136571.1 hypothetical protein [Enterococcus faecalis]MDR0026393.1 hypothetical protein [Enterococcus faecalis]NSN29301.1 hypothetical protein [Enterococcus faecalis]
MREASKQEPNKVYSYEDELKHQKQLSDSILKNFLHEMPLINSLLDHNWESFSLRNSPRETINTFNNFYDQLIKEYNDFLFRKNQVLSPVQPLQEIFLLPSKILSWFGITLKSVKARLFSLFSYFVVWIISNYGKDIVNWILSLF